MLYMRIIFRKMIRRHAKIAAFVLFIVFTGTVLITIGGQQAALYTLDLKTIEQREQFSGDERNAALGRVRELTAPFRVTEGGRRQVVLILAYLRGGSSLLGRLFSMNPDVFYWYEPVSDIYNSFSMARLMTLAIHVLYNRDGRPRNLTLSETDFISEYLWKIFTCKFSDLPVEFLASWTTMESPRLRKFRRCFQRELKRDMPKGTDLVAPVEQLCQHRWYDLCPSYIGESMENNCHTFMEAARAFQLNGSQIIQGKSGEVVAEYVRCLQPIIRSAYGCRHLADGPCRKAKMKATKITRLRLDTLNSVLAARPSTYEVFIIHELRDPRAIVASRRKDRRLTKRLLAAEARLVCHKMLEDILAAKKLSRTHPGALLRVRYEDLAANPLGVARGIYGHVGRELPDEVRDWLWENTHSTRDGGAFTETRKNASATARAWRQRLSSREKADITSECRDVLKEGGYDL